MTLYPIKRDRRYTITIEFCGFAKPHYVVRFCGDWIDSSEFKSSAIVRAVGEHARRNGALTVTELSK